MINKILDLLSKMFNKNRKYFKDFFSKVFEIIMKPEMMVLPGQLAFSFILSVVPIVSIISAIGTIFGVNVDTVSELLGRIFTSIQFDVIVPSIFEQQFNLKYLIVIIVLFYTASNGANSIIVASNQIYGIKKDNYFRRRFKAVVMTLLLCVLYIFILLVPLLGNKIISSLDYFNFKSIIDPILTIIRGPITWFIIYYFVKSIYVIAPDKEVMRSGINLGAVFTTLF